MLSKISSAFRLLRPRTIAGLSRAQDQLRQDLLKEIRSLRTELSESRGAVGGTLERLKRDVDASQRDLAERMSSLGRQLDATEATVDTLKRQTEQARAITRANLLLDSKLDSLDRLLDGDRITAHMRNAIASATLTGDPFPHAVVDGFLPDDFYSALLDGLPPVELFGDRPTNKQQLGVPFEIAPAYGFRVWHFMAGVVAKGALTGAVVDKFKAPLSKWLADNFPVLEQRGLDSVPMRCTDGRILLRTRGYRIPPHRDPKQGLLTCLLYLARPGDDQRWGTQFYAVDHDEEASHAKPHWIDDGSCRLVRDIPFVPNRALLWLNSVGAHGAFIPDDAPAGLERYAYQVRIGPTPRALNDLVSTIPPERQAVWLTKGDY